MTSAWSVSQIKDFFRSGDRIVSETPTCPAECGNLAEEVRSGEQGFSPLMTVGGSGLYIGKAAGTPHAEREPGDTRPARDEVLLIGVMDRSTGDARADIEVVEDRRSMTGGALNVASPMSSTSVSANALLTWITNEGGR